MGRPEWQALRDGVRPHEFVVEPGECSMAGSTSRLLSRTRLSGDRCMSPVICREPGSSAFSFWTWTQQRSLWLLHCTRVSGPASTVQDDCVGAAQSSFQITEAVCECGVGLDRCGRPPGSMSSFREVRAVAIETRLARVCREAGATT